MMHKIREAVLAEFRRRFDERMEPTDRLEDRGVNSMNFIQLMVSLEDALGLEFEDAQLNVKRYETLEDLMGYIEGIVEDR